jgi:hypothetical protein
MPSGHMSLFAKINEAAAGLRLTYLVIGGHAVIEHGFQRGTEYAALLARKEDRAKWQSLLENLGYRVIHDGATFLQFESREPGEWNVDLMLVPADTFARLLESAKPAHLEGASVVVPSLEHLLSLKIHALKHGQGLRVLKDMTDVAQLLSVNRVDPRADWVRALFEKCADLEHHERIVQLLS